jgi:hypothetical protein
MLPLVPVAAVVLQALDVSQTVRQQEWMAELIAHLHHDPHPHQPSRSFRLLVELNPQEPLRAVAHLVATFPQGRAHLAR